MNVTVIIPTFHRPRALMKGLRSLQDQTSRDFEILVVDNAADAGVEHSVADFNVVASIPARYLPEPELGLHNARHAGARAANGEILVFTDDDATFDPGWLQAYASAFEAHPEMVAAGGPVRPVWEVPPPQWLLDYINKTKVSVVLSLMEPYQEFRLDPKGYFFGVNMAIRRDILFDVGGFNPEAFGDVWLGDGESGLNQKLWKRGMLVGYVIEALVYHHIPAERMTVEYLRRRAANQGACDIYARFHHHVPCFLSLCKHAATISMKNNKYWLAAFYLRGRSDLRAVTIQTQAARTRSQVRYVIDLMLNRDLRELVLKENWLNE